MRRLGLGLGLANASQRGGAVGMAKFTAGINFVAGTAYGGTQPYGNNTDDGRLFRDPNNITPTWIPNAAGLLVPINNAGVRRSDRGAWHYPSYGTCRNLQSRDFTNVAWVASGITPARSNGADGGVNSGSRLTATAPNGTILQNITLASAVILVQVDIKRVSGTGAIRLTTDGVTFTDITPGAGAFSLQSANLAAVTNPVVGIQMATAGDVIDVDFFNTYSNPINGMLVPNQYRVATVGATILNSQSRPSADIADALPRTFVTIGQGAFGWSWQGRSERPSGGFIMTSSAGFQVSILATGAGGGVQFGSGALSTVADLTWRVGLGQLNKAMGYLTAAGAIRMACNGVLGTLGAGATLSPAMDHFDLCTNGSGANSQYGLTERFDMGANISFSDAELIALTT